MEKSVRKRKWTANKRSYTWIKEGPYPMYGNTKNKEDQIRSTAETLARKIINIDEFGRQVCEHKDCLICNQLIEDSIDLILEYRREVIEEEA
jgi:hypothetical protein